MEYIASLLIRSQPWSLLISEIVSIDRRQLNHGIIHSSCARTEPLKILCWIISLNRRCVENEYKSFWIRNLRRESKDLSENPTYKLMNNKNSRNWFCLINLITQLAYKFNFQMFYRHQTWYRNDFAITFITISQFNCCIWESSDLIWNTKVIQNIHIFRNAHAE